MRIVLTARTSVLLLHTVRARHMSFITETVNKGIDFVVKRLVCLAVDVKVTVTLIALYGHACNEDN